MFETLHDAFVSSLSDKVSSISSTMSGTLTAPLTAAMTLYIILYGWAVLRGSVQEPVMDFTMRAVKLLVIWTLVTSAGDYSSWVSTTITEGIPEFISSSLGGSDSGALSDPVMAKAGAAMTKIQELYGSGPIGAIYGLLMSLVVLLLTFPFAAIAFVISLIVEFGFTLLAAVGPLFIAFALFDFSRGWFFAWLGQIINFGLLQLLVNVLMVIMASFIDDVYSTIDFADGMAALAAFGVAMAAGTLFFFLIPSIAAALSAGAGASTGAAQRFVERKLLGGKSGGDKNSGGGSGTRTS